MPMMIFANRQKRTVTGSKGKIFYGNLISRCCTIISFVMLLLFLSACAGSLTRQQNQALMEILSILDSVIAEAEGMLHDNPDPTAQFRDILDRLHYMKEIIEEIKKGNAPYDEELLKKYTEKIAEIEANIKNSLNTVLSSDVFFALGRYRISDLSEEGKGILKDFTDTIMNVQVQNFRKLFPDRLLTVSVKVVGYADETPPAGALAAVLSQEFPGSLPADPVERKKHFNEKLSFLRAQTISDYVQQELAAFSEMKNLRIAPTRIIGLGEEYPYPPDYARPPYQPEDKRRRICKIYSKIQIDSEP
ncbi:MAG: hypothetical protein V2I97_17500 [Desulfococcaceae bacterium]|jgi:outer membrane protein OmpA-like peptidoglycan-associated protein|nr:hypothetical protein [Desulfococcaceae bacterium]